MYNGLGEIAVNTLKKSMLVQPELAIIFNFQKSWASASLSLQRKKFKSDLNYPLSRIEAVFNCFLEINHMAVFRAHKE